MYPLLMMVVLITVNVGIFNLLPLPALDGGRLMFLIYEGIFRRPVNPKYEGIVHAIGLILLLLLMVVVTFSDIWRLVTG
jgi:regulator of sigma E protease